MRIRNFGRFNLAVVQAVRQTAKFNSPPNFPAIRYIQELVIKKGQGKDSKAAGDKERRKQLHNLKATLD